MVLHRNAARWRDAGPNNGSKIVGRRWFPNTAWGWPTIEAEIGRAVETVPSFHWTNVARFLGVLTAQVTPPPHAGCGWVLVGRKYHDVVAGAARNARVAVETDVGVALLAEPTRPTTPTNTLDRGQSAIITAVAIGVVSLGTGKVREHHVVAIAAGRVGGVERLVFLFRQGVYGVRCWGDVVLGGPFCGNVWWKGAVVVGGLGEKGGVELVAGKSFCRLCVEGRGEGAVAHVFNRALVLQLDCNARCCSEVEAT